MKITRFCLATAFALLTTISGAIISVTNVEARGEGARAVSSQGVLRPVDRPLNHRSPSGAVVASVTEAACVNGRWTASLTVVAPGGQFLLADVPGNGFHVSDVPSIISIEAPEEPSMPSSVRVFGLEGRNCYEGEFPYLVEPSLSSDGRSFVFRHGEGLLALDLVSFRERRYPHLDLFAAGPAGRLAGIAGGELRLFDAGGPIAPVALPGGERALRLAFTPEGDRVLLLTDRSLFALDVADPSHASWRPVFMAPLGAALRDIAVGSDSVDLGLRWLSGGVSRGERVTLDRDGNVIDREEGPEAAISQAPEACGVGGRHGPIPWPLAPNAQHPVGDTYGEYQYYGGSPYMHPGVDVMGSAGQPVYAVRGGVVKAVLTTSADLHWRVAIADEATSGTSPGFLYAHLDLPTIAVSVGDNVVAGQYLGDLVFWTVASFHHCHFARIEDSGVQWDGSWLCIENPHLDFQNQSETEAPFFEPIGSQLFAFCNNETSTYQNPQALHGQVDIIAHVGDRIGTSWVCSVQEIRYTIYRVGLPGTPLVDDKLAVDFDMVLDTYINGPIDPFLVDLLYKQDSTCPTTANYDVREYYHIVTNSDGNSVYEESDRWEAWDTTPLPDTQYVVRVTIRDVAGNTAVDSMTVRTDNDNPVAVGESDPSLEPVLSCANPVRGAARATLVLGARQPISLAIYDASGRRIRDVASGLFPAGSSALVWDGRDAQGRTAAPGIYFWRLVTPVATELARIVRLGP